MLDDQTAQVSGTDEEDTVERHCVFLVSRCMLKILAVLQELVKRMIAMDICLDTQCLGAEMGLGTCCHPKKTMWGYARCLKGSAVCDLPYSIT